MKNKNLRVKVMENCSGRDWSVGVYEGKKHLREYILVIFTLPKKLTMLIWKQRNYIIKFKENYE